MAHLQQEPPKHTNLYRGKRERRNAHGANTFGNVSDLLTSLPDSDASTTTLHPPTQTPSVSAAPCGTLPGPRPTLARTAVPFLFLTMNKRASFLWIMETAAIENLPFRHTGTGNPLPKETPPAFAAVSKIFSPSSSSKLVSSPNISRESLLRFFVPVEGDCLLEATGDGCRGRKKNPSASCSCALRRIPKAPWVPSNRGEKRRGRSRRETKRRRPLQIGERVARTMGEDDAARKRNNKLRGFLGNSSARLRSPTKPCENGQAEGPAGRMGGVARLRERSDRTPRTESLAESLWATAYHCHESRKNSTVYCRPRKREGDEAHARVHESKRKARAVLRKRDSSRHQHRMQQQT